MGSLKRQSQSEPTTLMSLGDDMLAEILRRLPSQPSLARASFACPRLRDVASSSSVASRFTSPSPLLGYFISDHGGDIACFHRAPPLRPRCRCHPSSRRFPSRGFRGLQLAPYGLPPGPPTPHQRALHGRVRPSLKLTTAHTPLHEQRRQVIPLLPTGFRRCDFIPSALPRAHGWQRVRAHVYSSCTGEWYSHSRAPNGIKPPRRGEQNSYNYQPMHAGGRICWRTKEQMLSLDVGSMKFSHLALPDKLCSYHRSHYSYVIGDTEDGITCLLAVVTYKSYHDKPVMLVWFLEEEEGLPSWELQWTVDSSEWDLLARVPSVVKVCDVTAGVVLLCMGNETSGLRYRAFRIKDCMGSSNKRPHSLFLADFVTSAGWVHPYSMAWPRPSLKVELRMPAQVGSDKEAAPGSIERKQD
ncbi:unnamed protein product [Alopecurus aequalis]